MVECGSDSLLVDGILPMLIYILERSSKPSSYQAVAGTDVSFVSTFVSYINRTWGSVAPGSFGSLSSAVEFTFGESRSTFATAHMNLTLAYN